MEGGYEERSRKSRRIGGRGLKEKEWKERRGDGREGRRGREGVGDE